MRIGIDLGGSHVGIGLVDNKLELVDKLEENITEIEKEQIETSLVKKIKENTERLLSMKNVSIETIESIGIACPGTVYNGEIVKSRKFRALSFSTKTKIRRNLGKTYINKK